jgi:hypothetical protein
MALKFDSATGSIQFQEQTGGAVAAASGKSRLDVTNTGVLRLTNSSGVTANIPNQVLSIDWQYFSSSGTWTKPAGAVMVTVICVGGGGGGGGGRRGAAASLRSCGCGGGAGAATMLTYSAGELLASETITVGAGGTSGAAGGADNTSGSNGGNGGDTFFGGTLATNSKQMANGAFSDTAQGSKGQGGGVTFGEQGGNSSTTFVPSYQFFGSSGANVQVTPRVPGFGPGGGGCGSTLDTSNVSTAATEGADAIGAFFRPITTGGGGTAVPTAIGGAGAPGITDGTSTSLFGSGGGGGSLNGNVGRAGGAGGAPGGGGGGGSCSLNGNAAGAGGAGAAGGVYVISIVLS